MQTRKLINIPVVSAPAQEEAPAGCDSPDSNCTGNELVALMVLGDSMIPEFAEGEILVIETGRRAAEGSYVIAEVVPEDYTFRQLRRDDRGGWHLHALNPTYPDAAIAGLEAIKGVVIHKRNARSRKTVKWYVEQGAG